MFLDGADGARIFAFDGSWLWHDLLLILDGHLQPKLQLSFGSSVELLIDRCIVGIEDNEGCRTIGVTFEDSLGGRWDRKQNTELRIIDG